MIPNYYLLAPAKSTRRPGQFIWREENPPKVFRFYVSTYDNLKARYDTTEKIAHELCFPGEPVNLFMDLDLKLRKEDEGLPQEELQRMAVAREARMKENLVELEKTVRALLQENYGLGDVKMWILDCSREEKQSKHVFFDAQFASLADLCNFMNEVAARCRCCDALDTGLYNRTGGASSSLRLPLARKLDPGSPRLMPQYVQDTPFCFEKCLMNVVIPTERLLTCDGPAKKVQVEYHELWSKLVRYLDNHKPTCIRGDKNEFHVSLAGVVCPGIGRRHENQRTMLHVYMRNDHVDRAYFVCQDKDCKGDDTPQLKWSLPANDVSRIMGLPIFTQDCTPSGFCSI